MSQVQQSSSAPITSIQAFRQLRKAEVAPGTGAIKAQIANRGNEYVREGSGMIVKIYNTTLFPTKEEQMLAVEAYKLGLAEEAKGDLIAADLHFRDALNRRVSFSIPQNWANAADYDACFEVIGVVEQVDSVRNPGAKVWTLNRVRPVAVATAIEAGSAFEAPAAPIAQPIAIPTKARNKAKNAETTGK